jgi:hypothetical protein
MSKAPSNLQDLRRGISGKAKADTTGRFWGLYAGEESPGLRLEAVESGVAGRDPRAVRGLSSAAAAPRLTAPAG